MRDEDRRDSFALYNPIEMQKLNENYTVPADASPAKMINNLLLKILKMDII